MTRNRSIYVCQKCGETQPKWVGQCDQCGVWNSYLEEALEKKESERNIDFIGKEINLHNLANSTDKVERISTNISEFDRVCGGGLVPGSVILVGGEPGIGKSTLMLQILGALVKQKKTIESVYISGEEGIEQIRLRSQRLNLYSSLIRVATSTNVADISKTLEVSKDTQVVVIDSVQTLQVDGINSDPGTVSQVRASAQELIHLAKASGFTLFLVGHVTKDGTLAGPKVLEHMVDTVLYFEGERNHQFRILRATKNRFGAIDEIGIFQMGDLGLSEVSNPSALFLGGHEVEIIGSSVFAGNEGNRPMLLEIQALTARTAFGTPRRAVVGWDTGRLNMILAVLEARCGISFGNHDVYLNIAGGIRVSEPAADLAVAAALVSSLTKKSVPKDSILFGEIGLSGEIRQVSHTEARIKEAIKLGFKRAIIPSTTYNKTGERLNKKAISDIQTNEIKMLNELVNLFKCTTSK